MAAKKPNKVNSGTTTKEVDRLGKATMYIGYKTAGFTCPTGKRNLIKGIIYEH
ncbi:MAG: hypothetical protein RLZZ629_184, partial [Actinomycetota bacterium]